MARASAPAKVMLFGEYAVLEGHPALALALDRRLACHAEPGDRLRIAAPGVLPEVELAPGLLDGPCPSAPLALLWPILQAHAPRAGVSLTFEADFPPTWGLGSSSASTLAAAAALRALAGRRTSAPELFVEALAAQRALQGAASGYDVATQVLGGCVAYRQTPDGPRPGWQPLGDGAEAAVLPARDDLRWIVAWTGDKASTGSMIRRVRERFPAGHSLYSEIGAVAAAAVEAWCSGGELGPLLDEGHRLLDALGAVPSEAAAVIRALQADPDVLGARMCGAGGGDCVLVLADDPAYARRAIERHGLQILPVQPEAEGLRVETAP